MRFPHFKTPLGLFSTLWALSGSTAFLNDYPENGFWIYPFTLLLLIFPERIFPLAIFSLVYGIGLFFRLPATGNPSLISLLVSICLLVGCLWVLLHKKSKEAKQLLWNSVRVPIQAVLIIFYFFVVFHKLNSSFFDPTTSCAIYLLKWTVYFNGLFGLIPSTMYEHLAFNIYLTMFFEVMIFIFLLWRRFVYIGLLAGLIFHTGLAWAGFFQFTTTMFALYIFFIPWENGEKIISKIPKWILVNFYASLALLIISSFYFRTVLKDFYFLNISGWNFSGYSLMFFFWTLMMIPLLYPVFSKVRSEPDRIQVGKTIPILWLIPLITFINGTTPYLGLKTIANFSMFSNIRTEGGRTNHFLIPSGLFFVADYQNDLARIYYWKYDPPKKWPLLIEILGKDKWITRSFLGFSRLANSYTPFIEIRRVIQEIKGVGFTNVSITYERGGKIYEIENAFLDPQIMQPLNFWEQKFLAFKAQDVREESSCRW